MKKSIRFLIFPGILIIILSVSAMAALNNTVINMNGRYGTDKLGVKVRQECRKACLTLNDMEDLCGFLKTEEIACYSLCSSMVSYCDRQFDVKIAGVNYRYKDFCNIPVKYGSFFTAAGERDGSFPAVIGSDLALAVFNTDNVAGKKLTIQGREYEITGVYEQQGRRDRNGVADGNIIEMLTDDGLPLVYVPVGKLLDSGSVQGIEAFQVHMAGGGILGRDEDKIKAALLNLGKNPGDYIITDYRRMEKLIWQLPRMVVFVCGCIITACLLGYVSRRLAAFASLLKEGLRDSYAAEFLCGNAGSIAVLLLPAGAACLLGFAVWRLIAFRLYIPPEYIADELIDIQYYSGLLKGKVISHNSELGFIPDIAARGMDIALNAGFLMAAAGILAGIPLLYAGFRELRYRNAGPEKIAVYCFTCITAALLLAFLFCRWLGIGFYMESRLLAVICILLLCMVLETGRKPVNLKEKG